MSDLMTRAEAAAYLTVRETWLRDNAGKPGYPPMLKLGHFVRYRRTDLDAWLRLNRHS